jgi:hypothetical protein
VAVFENPDQINPLPAVDDLPGSAIDAQVLSLYVWLAANRYNEYRSAACVCLAESLSEAYVIAPAGFSLFREAQPIPLDRFRKGFVFKSQYTQHVLRSYAVGCNSRERTRDLIQVYGEQF